MVIDLIAGGGIALAGVILGRLLPARKKIPDAPEAICGCGDEFAYHDPKTGECHQTHYLGGGGYEQCQCRQYTGPRPLESFYATEIRP